MADKRQASQLLRCSSNEIRLHVFDLVSWITVSGCRPDLDVLLKVHIKDAETRELSQCNSSTCRCSKTELQTANDHEPQAARFDPPPFDLRKPPPPGSSPLRPSSCSASVCPQEEEDRGRRKVLVLGLDGAGKSSMLQGLSAGEAVGGRGRCRPTRGFSFISLDAPACQLDFLESKTRFRLGF